MSMHSKAQRRQFLVASRALAASLSGVAFLGQAHAQTAPWPAKPIKIVVAFPPGGLTDAIARNYGEFLSTRLGVPVIIENKPGAGARCSWRPTRLPASGAGCRAAALTLTTRLKSKPAGLVVEGEAVQRWMREAEPYRRSANAIAV